MQYKLWNKWRNSISVCKVHIFIPMFLILVPAAFSQGITVARVDGLVNAITEHKGMIIVDYVNKESESVGTIVYSETGEGLVSQKATKLDESFFIEKSKKEFRSAKSFLSEKNESYMDLKKKYKKEIVKIGKLFISHGDVKSISEYDSKVVMIFASNYEESNYEGSMIILFDTLKNRFDIIFGSDKDKYDTVFLKGNNLYYTVASNIFQYSIQWVNN
jgi:hypothetical protein